MPVITPKTTVIIEIDNLSGAVECRMSAPLPFVQIAAVLGQLLANMAAEAAAQQGAVRVKGGENGSGS